MKKAGTTKCPKCKGKGWEPGGVMTLYYASGRMRQLQNRDSEDPIKMEDHSAYNKKLPAARTRVLPEQLKLDSEDSLKRKVLSACTLCNGKKRVNKDTLLMMVLRGEIKMAKEET